MDDNFDILGLGSFGGPLCEIIAFSQLHDIFPNFTLVSKIFSKPKIDFSLGNIRPRNRTSEEEKKFLRRLVSKSVESDSFLLNESLFLRLIRLKVFDFTQSFSHSSFHSEIDFLNIFFIFGYQKIVDYCVTDRKEVVDKFEETGSFTNNISYISFHSNSETLRWWLRYYNVKKKLARLPAGLSLMGLRSALAAAKIDNFELIVEELDAKKWISQCDVFNSVFSILSRKRDNYFEKVKSVIVFMSEQIGKEKLKEEDLLKICHVAITLELFDLFEFIACDICKDRSDFITKFFFTHIAPQKKHNIYFPTTYLTQRSTDYLFEKYPSEMSQMMYRNDVTRNSIYFGSLKNLMKIKCSKNKINSYFQLSCEEGHFHIAKYLLEKYINEKGVFQQRTLQICFASSVKNGYYNIFKLLLDSELINYSTKHSTFDGILYEVIRTRKREKILWIYIKSGLLDLSNKSDFNTLLNFVRSSRKFRPSNQINEDVELEFCKILKSLLSLSKKTDNKQFDPFLKRYEYLVLECIKKEFIHLSEILLQEMRMDPSANNFHKLYQYCEKMENYDDTERTIELFIKYYLNHPAVQDSFEECCDTMIEHLINKRRFSLIMEIKKNLRKGQRLNLHLNDHVVLKKFSKIRLWSFEKSEKEFLKFLIEDENVDISIHENVFIQNLFEVVRKKRNVGMLRMVLDDKRVNVCDKDYLILKSLILGKKSWEELNVIKLKIFLEYTVGKEMLDEIFKGIDDDGNGPESWGMVKERVKGFFPDVVFN